MSSVAGNETPPLQRWADDGGAARRAVGGLIVAAGYAPERLEYLAASLSEALPRALWARPLGQDTERRLRLVLAHLLAGTTVVQLAEADQLGLFLSLAEQAGACLLHVRSLPPAISGRGSGQAVEQDARQTGSPRRVCVQASESLRTQRERVLAAWNHPGDAP